MSNLNKMIIAASDSDPAGFNKAFQAEMQQRVVNAINAERGNVVGKMFGINEDCGCEDKNKDKDEDEVDDELREAIEAMSDEELDHIITEGKFLRAVGRAAKAGAAGAAVGALAGAAAGRHTGSPELAGAGALAGGAAGAVTSAVKSVAGKVKNNRKMARVRAARGAK